MEKKQTRILVTGACGQLGCSVVKELLIRGIEVLGTDILPREAVNVEFPYISFDITDSKAVSERLGYIQPTAVIHCAAWTAVDAAEEDENRNKVFNINVRGTQNLAEACKEIDCKLLYISTDYVFNGQGNEPWDPDCKDYAPLCVYGQSKLEGELAVSKLLQKYFIVRIAWLFGPKGQNFVKTMLKVGKTHETVRVVNDQIGTPTYTPDLARLLVDMIQTEEYGYYHATNECGFISWYDFCCAIYKEAGIKTEVIPVSTAEYGVSKAKRPFNSRLSKEKLTIHGFDRLPDWQDALHRYIMYLQIEEND